MLKNRFENNRQRVNGETFRRHGGNPQLGCTERFGLLR